MAMPWAIFFRDREVYESRFPDLAVDRVELHTVLLYVLSGGVSMRSLAPGFLFQPLRALERLLPGRTFASMMTVELVRR